MADKHRCAIPSCLIGNCMKLDDFTLYGVFAIFNGHTEVSPLITRAGFTKRSNGVNSGYAYYPVRLEPAAGRVAS